MGILKSFFAKYYFESDLERKTGKIAWSKSFLLAIKSDPKKLLKVNSGAKS